MSCRGCFRSGRCNARLRNGAGYRVNFSTRLEALYIRTTKKDEAGRFASESQAIDFRLKLAF